MLPHDDDQFGHVSKTVWPSGLRRWLQAPVRTGVGSNPTAVSFAGAAYAHVTASTHSSQLSHDACVAPTVLGPRPAENKMEHIARRPERTPTAVSIAGASCAYVRASTHPSPRDTRQSSCARGSHCPGAQSANHNQTAPNTTHNQSPSKWYRGPWPMTRPLPCPAKVPGPKTKARWDTSCRPQPGNPPPSRGYPGAVSPSHAVRMAALMGMAAHAQHGDNVDSEGVPTPAGRAQWMSSPSP